MKQEFCDAVKSRFQNVLTDKLYRGDYCQSSFQDRLYCRKRAQITSARI